jgi:hypothetical protein
MSYSCGFRETRQLQAAVLQLLTVHDSVCAWYTILALAGCCFFPDLFPIHVLSGSLSELSATTRVSVSLS